MTVIQDVMREAPPWMTLELAKHYLTYAMGAYSWPFVMYRWPFSGLCRLLSKMLCCACIRRKPHIVQDDNCCLCNLAGFRHISGLDMEDVLYASFENAVFQHSEVAQSSHRLVDSFDIHSDRFCWSLYCSGSKIRVLSCYRHRYMSHPAT
uniref:Uncharacterized protein n=1 Tax=Timema tahoe TaxID=61484 RepID=A0A7R9IEN8_9NEOP|nr:unnamed protein product [Timema tahoe]